MGWIITIIIIVGAYWLYKKYSGDNARNNIVESSEFQTALAEARSIWRFFSTATSLKGGLAIPVLQTTDRFGRRDSSNYECDNCIYFKVRLDYGYSPFLSLIKSQVYSEKKRMDWMNNYLLEVYGKSKEEIMQQGIDPTKLVYDIQEGEDPCEGILYYAFPCPCGLKGSAREIFYEKLSEKK